METLSNILSRNVKLVPDRAFLVTFVIDRDGNF